MSGNGLPRPLPIRGSSPRTRCTCGKAENKSDKWSVLSLKFRLLDELARAMYTGSSVDWVDTRLDRRAGTPGSGWHWGKYLACKPACLAKVSSGVMGSWAQSWKILLAYGSCEC